MTLAEQFIQEGLQEGLESGLRKSILEVLVVRFDKIPAGLAEAVGVVSGYERLRSLHRSAILAASLEEFSASL